MGGNCDNRAKGVERGVLSITVRESYFSGGCNANAVRVSTFSLLRDEESLSEGMKTSCVRGAEASAVNDCFVYHFICDFGFFPWILLLVQVFGNVFPGFSSR